MLKPEIVKRIHDEAKGREKSVQVPLQIPLPDYDKFEEDEVSVVSTVIEIDL